MISGIISRDDGAMTANILRFHGISRDDACLQFSRNNLCYSSIPSVRDDAAQYQESNQELMVQFLRYHLEMSSWKSIHYLEMIPSSLTQRGD